MSVNTLTTGSSLCAETQKALGLLEDTVKQLRTEALSLDELSRCNAHQHPFENAAKAYSKQIEEHMRFMQDRWDFTCNEEEIGRLYVPRPRGHCKTLLILPPARVIAGPEHLCAKWREENKFKVWTFADGKLNECVPNDRRHLCMYALLHRGGRDADKELRNRSFEQNQNEGVETMRAVEVLYFEDFNFRSTGEHLDPDTVTTTGSLTSDGRAVGVYWDDGVGVGQYALRDAYPSWGSRAAVYL